jgi:orotidine 5'-phosphate decarboxylase subfamily 2
MTFTEQLIAASKTRNSLVCVGLDTDPAKIPAHLGRDSKGVVAFNRAIVDATADTVCCYKPNAAFYEALGPEGISALISTRRHIPVDIPVILDVKRGDIGTTAERYAAFAYDVIGADAVTVNPYMGFDAVRPFLRPGKGVFVLCLTSNPTAADFQFLSADGRPLFEHVAEAAVRWAQEGDIGLVAGATRPEHLARIREIAPELPVLVPGVGAQGGDAGAVIAELGGGPGSVAINS